MTGRDCPGVDTVQAKRLLLTLCISTVSVRSEEREEVVLNEDAYEQNDRKGALKDESATEAFSSPSVLLSSSFQSVESAG